MRLSGTIGQRLLLIYLPPLSICLLLPVIFGLFSISSAIIGIVGAMLFLLVIETLRLVIYRVKTLRIINNGLFIGNALVESKSIIKIQCVTTLINWSENLFQITLDNGKNLNVLDKPLIFYRAYPKAGDSQTARLLIQYFPELETKFVLWNKR